MPKKKRLLFVNGHLNVGGVEKSLIDLLRHLDYSKYDVDLLLLQDKGDYEYLLPKEVRVLLRRTDQSYGPLLPTLFSNIMHGRFGDAWYRILMLLTDVFGNRVLRFMRPLLHIARHYDFAVAYRVGPAAKVVAYTVNAERKICWWHHGVFNIPTSQLKETEEVWAKFDSIVVVADYCKQMLKDVFPSLKIDYVTIPNMVDFEQITSLSKQSFIHKKEAKIRLVTVCRLSPEKHIENIVYAIEKLRKLGYRDFVWYVVGDGPDYDHIKALTVEKGLDDVVLLIGNQANPFPIVNSVDIYVNTSYVESQCLTVLEAMVLNKPCVVTRTDGTDEYTVSGENSITCKQDIDGLVEAIAWMIDNRDQWPMLTKNSADMARERFSPSTITACFDKLLGIEYTKK